MRPPPSWRQSLRGGVGNLAELCSLLQLTPESVGASPEAAADFPLRVPHSFVARMRPGDPRDPLLRQVLPTLQELQGGSGFSLDPTGDQPAASAPGLLHKYQGRVLFITTGACAVHCRYCFRRHFPYAEHQPRGGEWAQALRYIAADRSIEEVILSGGDPLVLADEKLADLGRSLAGIAHLRRLRIHSRLPIVLPERVDDRLLAWLAASRLKPVLVLHANHANEIDSAVGLALDRLRRIGVTLLNQAVLLRGINDHVEALCHLSEAVFEAGALPYYLHLLDRVRGAAHFEVDEASARRLLRQMIDRMPGYLVPKLVREEAGAAAKVALSPAET